MMQAVIVEDASGFQGHADRIVAPATEVELIQLLREANANRVPVTIAGAGTGITGASVAFGGWRLSLERFNRISVETGRAKVGAGVLLRDVQAAAARTGQFYAPDPTENSSAIAGNIATNASGSRSFKYGDTRRHVLGLRVALMDGSVMPVRRGDKVDFPVPATPLPQSTKHSAGYKLEPGMDWVDLFVGSEGTLGVVVEAELQLLPAPKHFLAGVVFFPDDDATIDAVEAWRPIAGLRMLEYFDGPSLRLLAPKYPEIPANAGGALLIEQELSSPDSEEIDLWPDRLAAVRAWDEASWFGTSDADRERFRQFRHALPETVNDTVRRNGYLKTASDYAVPIPRNRENLALYRRTLEAELPGSYVIFGHIGDAHVHINILPRSQAEFDRGKELMIEFARQAVSMGGTVSAEHGLGKRKAYMLALQYPPEVLEAMKAVKRRLDPNWLLGQGTLFPM